MTKEQFRKAQAILRMIDSYKYSLDILHDEQNTMYLPEDMWNRHLEEKQSALRIMIQNLEQEFAIL